MIKKTIITKDKLKSIFPDRLYLMGAYMRLNEGANLTIGSRDFKDMPEYNVRRLTSRDGAPAQLENTPIGVYSITHLENLHEYRNILLHTSDVTVLEVPSVAEKMKPILDKFMKDRYFVKSAGDRDELYLYYPEFTITNSIGESHLIKDMVVCLDLTVDGIAPGITGKRFSFTKQELSLGYVHSHLSTHSETLTDFQDFCIGDRSALRNYMSKLETGCTSEQFELLLVQIEQFLVWESIEGNPYISISKLFTNQQTLTPATLGNTIRSVFAREILKRLKPNMLFALDDYTYVINTSAAAGAVFAVEREVTDLVLNQGTIANSQLYDYDLDTDAYQGGTRDYSNMRLPNETTNYHKDVLAALKITPSIYETKQLAPRTTVIRRVGSSDLGAILHEINELLTYGHRLNGQNNISSESKNIHNGEAAVANNNTAQPVSQQPRMVGAVAV